LSQILETYKIISKKFSNSIKEVSVNKKKVYANADNY
jgi:hypothetical protein